MKNSNIKIYLLTYLPTVLGQVCGVTDEQRDRGTEYNVPRQHAVITTNHT